MEDDIGRQDLGKADTRSNKGKQTGETRPSERWTHHPTKGIKKGYNGRQAETRPSRRRAHHPTRGNKKGDKGRQDPREGGHTIQQRETRTGTRGAKGRQDPREGGHTIQHQGGHLKKALRTPNSTRFGEKFDVKRNWMALSHQHARTIADVRYMVSHGVPRCPIVSRMKLSNS